MATVRSIRRTPPRRPAPPKLVHQFLIVLTGIDPLVWRRIRVPAAYSFWDLHVAIQDAMGWLAYHLHEFRRTRTRDVSPVLAAVHRRIVEGCTAQHAPFVAVGFQQP